MAKLQRLRADSIRGESEGIVNLAVTILIGVAMGIIVELLLPRHILSELLLVVLLGVAGALLARHIGASAGWFGISEPASFLAALGGATLVLLAYSLVSRRRRKRHP